MKPEEHVRLFSGKNDRKLKAICEPLKKFGIDTFWYYTISDTGHFSFIGNQSIIGEYFYHKKLFVNHPSFRSSKLISEGTSFFNKETDKSGAQEKIKDVFAMDQIYQVIKKKDNSIHGYGFATTQQDQDLTSVYMKKSHLLLKFIHYFHEEASSIITKAHENKVHISPLIGDYFYQSLDIEKKEEKNEEEFIKMIGCLPPLSEREMQCLALLIRGKPARQIGEELQISNRTVEHYLESIKNKWSCLNKQELIEKGLIYIYGL